MCVCVCVCAGITGGVLVDGEKPSKWTIYSLEFKHDFVEQWEAHDTL